MTTSRDYYEVLGIGKDASPEDIKKAFRQQALKYHPDRNREPGAGDKFKEVAEAYQILNDPERRTAYDRFGHAGVNGGSARGFDDFAGFGGFGDIFDAFFGGVRADGPRRGADLEYQVTISFLESAFGGEKLLDLTRTEVCSGCNGSRAEPGTEVVTCSSCRGSGQVRRVQRMVFGQFQQVTTCSTCAGAGSYPTEACSQCRGRGLERRRRKIAVEIPAGIDDGSRLRISREGEQVGGGGEPGDLYVYFRVEPHPQFDRHGNDVLYSTAIDVAKAALGGKMTVPTLEGETELSIPAGTQSGQVFCLRGRGMPQPGRPSRRGDQLVTVSVATPMNLNKRQRELLRELGASFGDDPSNGADGGLFDKLKGAFGSDGVENR